MGGRNQVVEGPETVTRRHGSQGLEPCAGKVARTVPRWGTFERTLHNNNRRSVGENRKLVKSANYRLGHP
jgi:hypothetical protein